MKFLSLSLMSLAFLAACGKDKGDTSSSGDDGADGASCTVSLSGTSPSDGASDVAGAGPFTATLSVEDPSAEITVWTTDGTAVSGTSSVSGTTVSFAPDAALDGSTSYQLKVTWCDAADESTITFTTANSDPAAVTAGLSYKVDLTTANWEQPAGLGDLIAGSITTDILIGVAAVDDTSLTLIGATTTDLGGPQDFCASSINFPAADWSSNPYFSAGPSDVALVVQGVAVSIKGFNLSGTFNSDASAIGGAQLSGQIDVRDIAPLVEPLLGTSDPDEICGALAGFGATCVTCGSDSEPYCIDVLITEITASQIPATVECVDEENCHTECSSSDCSDPAAGECE